MADYLSLLPFLGAVFLAASSGAVFKPDEWYRALKKPAWTPPDWAFPLGRMVIYLLTAFAGWQFWLADSLASKAPGLTAFGVQLILNGLWSGVFFGLRRLDLALIGCVVLWLAVALNMILFMLVDTTAGLLLLPYLAWVAFAASLNAAIWRMNLSQDRLAA